MDKWKDRPIALPDHPLLGRVVEVQALIYSPKEPRLVEVDDPMDLRGFRLVFEDGRVFEVNAIGPEVDGITITKVEAPHV